MSITPQSTADEEEKITYSRIVHPLTGRRFRGAQAWSQHDVFVPPGRGVGAERTNAIIEDRLMRKSYRPRSRQASTNPHVLRSLFRLYDADKSGSLDVDEFIRMLRDVGVQAVSEADCRQVFRHYDTDRDGTISYDEWCAIHCQHFRDDSRTANMLDLPSIRLDVKHAAMTEQESMAALRTELRRVLQTRSLESVMGCGHGTEHMDATAAKQRLMDARVGIGNELALLQLLRRECCSDGGGRVSLAALRAFVGSGQPTTAPAHAPTRPLASRPTTTRCRRPYTQKD